MSDTDHALLARIHAAPDDDEPRRVYADLLMERDDPRGEFITLQLQDTDRARQQALLDEHGTEWLGSLAGVLRPGYHTFARGFLDTCVIGKQASLAHIGDVIGHPDWATVRSLDLDVRETSTGLPIELVTHPVMGNLRELRSVTFSTLSDLQHAEPTLPTETLEYSGRFAELPGIEGAVAEQVLLSRLPGLPDLRRLRIRNRNLDLFRHGYDWLLTSSTGGQLTALSVRYAGGLAPWLSALDRVGSSIAELRVDDVSVTRPAPGEPWELLARWWEHHEISDVIRFLGDLRAEGIGGVALRFPARARPDEDQRRVLERAAERITSSPLKWP